MTLKEAIGKITRNFKTKCEFCRKLIKRKDAHFERVKRLEFVYPKNTSFCCQDCCDNYKEHEMSAPRRVSLCSSCPTPPGLLK